jgi:hypothetical protein
MWPLLLLGAACQGNRTVGSPQFLKMPPLGEIANGLLKNYDNLTRPDFGGGPTNVLCQFRINSLLDVVPQANEFIMDIFLRLKWNDTRLAYHDNIGNESLRIESDLVWKPDVYFYNKAGSTVVLEETLKVNNAGLVFWSRHFIAKFTAQFHLEDFPFDSQELTFRLAPFAFTKDTLHVHFYPLEQGGPVFPPINETFHSVLWSVSHDRANESSIQLRAGERAVDLIYYSIRISRMSGIYVLKYIMPLTAISVCSTFSYWITQASVPARSAIGVSLLIATITLNFVTQNDLPKVDYATNMDCYILCVFIFSFAVILEFAVSHYFYTTKQFAICFKIDQTFRFWTPIMVIHSLGILIKKGPVASHIKLVIGISALIITIVSFSMMYFLCLKDLQIEKFNEEIKEA